MKIYLKSQIELEQELREQMSALRASAVAYDTGALWEAKRLATTAFILVHDGGRRAQSLLTQLKLRREINFVSTVRPRDEEGESPLPLANIQIHMEEGWSTYSPFLSDAKYKKSLKFSKWWDEKVFTTDTKKSLSRMNLVFTLRNQMGGSHVDKEITSEAFSWLKTGAHVLAVGPAKDPEGKFVADSDWPFPKVPSGSVPNGHWATMRQIAWELNESISMLGY